MAILSILLQISILSIVAYTLYAIRKIEKMQLSHTDYLSSIVGYKLEANRKRKKSAVPFTPGPTLEPEDNSGSEFSPFPEFPEKSK